MLDSTTKMHSFQWKSFVTWLDVMEKHFPTECFIVLPFCMEQGNIGLDNRVVSLPRWTHLDYPPSSSLTVLLTSSGQSYQISFVPMIHSEAVAATKHSKKIQLSQTGSFTTTLRSSLMHFMLVYLELLNTGYNLNGNTVVVHICMVWHGFLMWTTSWIPTLHHEKN